MCRVLRVLESSGDTILNRMGVKAASSLTNARIPGTRNEYMPPECGVISSNGLSNKDSRPRTLQKQKNKIFA